MLVSLNLGVLLGGDILAHKVWDHLQRHDLAMAIIVVLHIVQWIVASALLLVQFSTIYYYAPDLKAKCWQWLTPGAMLGLLGWIGASLGLKAYLHFFNSYSVTYGSLGAVIVLLTWFYISGLMLLLGAEINSEIQAAVVERQLRLNGELLRGAETTVPDL